MIKVDYNKVKERESELIKYNGFLPFDILKYINLVKRVDFLKAIGKFDEIQEANLNYRINYKRQGDNYKNTVLKKWINDNPKFADLVVEI